MASLSEQNELIPFDDTIAAEVSVGFIPEDQDENALFNTEELNDGIFTDYFINHHYYSDPETYMMPVASPGGFDGDSVAFVQLAAETKLVLIDWSAEKVGTQPSMPDPELDDPNMVYLGKLYEPTNLMLKPGGLKDDIVYRISGTYVYGYKNPQNTTMYFGRPPWMDQSVDCAVPPKYKKGIISCSQNTTPSDSEGSQNTPSDPSQVGSFT